MISINVGYYTTSIKIVGQVRKRNTALEYRDSILAQIIVGQEKR